MGSYLTRLSSLDVCAVSDALDRMGLGGVAFGIEARSAPRRIVGLAVTVQLEPADGRQSTRHLCTAAVDAAGPDSIIVVAHQGRLDVAGWGGILSAGAKRNGVAGIIIDGACRDIDESRELDLTVYAKAVVPVTARGRIIETAWNEPVKIAGLSVAPADYVIADGSGIAFIPALHVESVLEVAERIAARERLMVGSVNAGDPLSRVMGADYEKMLDGEMKHDK